MVEEIKTGEFTSKYSLGEIVEMKMEGAGGFVGQVNAITFCIDSLCPAYHIRRVDGMQVTMAESEICIRGVDYDIDNT